MTGTKVRLVSDKQSFFSLEIFFDQQDYQFWFRTENNTFISYLTISSQLRAINDSTVMMHWVIRENEESLSIKENYEPENNRMKDFISWFLTQVNSYFEDSMFSFSSLSSFLFACF